MDGEVGLVGQWRSIELYPVLFARMCYNRSRSAMQCVMAGSRPDEMMAVAMGGGKYTE